MPMSTPLIWDTWVSHGLIPLRNDFVDYVDDVIPVKDVTKIHWVLNIGTTINKYIDKNGVAC